MQTHLPLLHSKLVCHRIPERKFRLASMVLTCSVAVVWFANTQAADLPIARGPFKPTLESLTNYSCPQWFRDAKFGIWAHWGPQAVPMSGDWYARHMYEPGHPQYQHHLGHYGHPSTNGYKDIIPLWKAEKWDPDRLMSLYKKAGAKYFVSMGSHHDNFYLWDSKLHPWNAVQMGPKRDVVGEWQAAARKHGLRFGVSEHLGASFTWWQDSHKADKTGPFAGVPYDGADPKYQELYHFPAEPGDTEWYSKNLRWQQQWFARIKELVDHYHPDLLYTDGGVPFGNEVGLSLIAHYYNSDPRRDGPDPQVVYTCKQRSEGRWVEDLERGVMAKVNPDPWQTDTSIGDWFYNENWKFRPVSWTIHMLVDIVSKNGNLLLNIVQRPDGSLDAEVEEALERLAEWIQVHGEAIYGTRPWQVYGEGPVRARGGHFKEDFAYTARDIRFTTKGNTLYATALGWPDDGKLFIRSLAKANDGKANGIRGVELLGHKGNVSFVQTAEALIVTLPTNRVSEIACTLRISGRDLKAMPLPGPVAVVIQPDAQGKVNLQADNAELHGQQIGEEQRAGQANIGFWDKPDEWVSWNLQFPASGKFEVMADCAAANGETTFVVELSGQKLLATAPKSASWDRFEAVKVGQFEVNQPGIQTLSIRPADAATWRAMNLRGVKLVRMGAASN
jgi:alpha-L-fucosidase